MIPLSNFLIVSAILFGLSLAGIILNRKNMIVLLMCIELLLLAVNTNFVVFASYLKDISGEVYVFFILTVAASESAIGLAILVLLFRNRGTINVQELDSLKG
jgi:NADH-quinone oxidoreductase subunit K